MNRITTLSITHIFRGILGSGGVIGAVHPAQHDDVNLLLAHRQFVSVEPAEMTSAPRWAAPAIRSSNIVPAYNREEGVALV